MQANTVGSLIPYPNKERAFEKNSGERGEVFVRFRDFGNELPKLVRAEFNGEVLCQNEECE